VKILATGAADKRADMTKLRDTFCYLCERN